WRHDLADPGVPKIHDREEELLFLFLEDAFLPPDVDVGLDLTVGRGWSLLPRALLEDPAHQDSHRGEQPRGRRDDRQEPRDDLLRVGAGPVPQQNNLGPEPARHEEEASPGERVDDPEVAEPESDREEPEQQEHLDQDFRRRLDDLDLARSGQQPRVLRMLLEQAPDLDRREPVESQGERLEEEEEDVADSRPGKQNHALSPSFNRRRSDASSASISPESVSWA